MDQQAASKQRGCFKCGYNADTTETNCPECSRPLQTSTSIRIRGTLLVLCGIFLDVLMVYIAIWMLGGVNSTAPAGRRFTGTHEQLMVIYGLLGLIFVLGGISFVTGLWQMILGRRNRLFVWIVVLLAVMSFVGFIFVYWTFGG